MSAPFTPASIQAEAHRLNDLIGREIGAGVEARRAQTLALMSVATARLIQEFGPAEAAGVIRRVVLPMTADVARAAAELAEAAPAGRA